MQAEKQYTYQKWTFSEEMFLLLNWEGIKSIEKIAQVLNKDLETIKRKSHEWRLEGRGRNAKWTEEETEYLELISETCTLDELVKRYNTHIKQNKKSWSYRTKQSIRKKLTVLGLSAKPFVGHITLAELSRYLGRNNRYMQKLIEEKKLKTSPTGTKVIYIKEKDFIKFAKKYPFDVGEKMTNEGMIWFLQILNDEE